MLAFLLTVDKVAKKDTAYCERIAEYLRFNEFTDSCELVGACVGDLTGGTVPAAGDVAEKRVAQLSGGEAAFVSRAVKQAELVERADEALDGPASADASLAQLALLLRPEKAVETVHLEVWSLPS